MEDLAVKELINDKSDSEKIWNEALKIIRENVSELTYNSWFATIKPIDYSNSYLKLKVLSDFHVEWIEERCKNVIDKALLEVLGPDNKILYVVEDAKNIPPNLPYQNISSNKEKIIAIEKNFPYESKLNQAYTFEKFINGEGNQLAYAAAVAVSNNPGQTTFNPLFVYGGVGLGKTHLIQAIGNKCETDFPDKKIFYIPTYLFAQIFIDALQKRTANEFLNFLQTLDVLILDDIQYLIGKEKTQDLFFQMFNSLHQSKKQIVLSSDKPPAQLKGLDERIISRFQWGLSADIQPPDYETRMAILKSKSENIGLDISDDILEYIAVHITSNIRELEGCLIKLMAEQCLSNKELNVELARKIIRELSVNKKVAVSIEHIVKTVSDSLGIGENKLREKNRKKEVALARQIAMYFCKKLTNNTLKTIGLHFGGKDHSTVVHAINSIEEFIKKDPKFKETIDVISQKIEISSF